MRRRYGSILALCVAFAAPASAQVINGESTYEDNFAHTPPPDDAAPSSRRDATKTQQTHRDAQPDDRSSH